MLTTQTDMAQNLDTGKTVSTNDKLTPNNNLLTTNTPHLNTQTSFENRNREDSDVTLYDDRDEPGSPPVDDGEAQENIKIEKTFSDIPRPSLATRRFDTEVPQPVAQRPIMPSYKRRSTGARRALTSDINPAALAEPSPSSSSPSSEWSSDDEAVQLQKSQTQPIGNPLSAKELNQVRKYPRRTFDRPPKKDGKLKVGNENFSSMGRVARDGRLDISVNETANTGYLAKALGATINRHLHPQARHEVEAAENLKREYHRDKKAYKVPRLNIVIMVIGSRGDIQPFLKIGKILQDKYNHRVRIATHPTFKKFVEEDIGLEFFSVGGDPAELMAFMVKNPGLIPTMETVKAGELGRRRDSMFEMFQGFWRACINATDDETDIANLKMMGNKYPFIADAIIANPPSFAHYHCAEKLGIPLHLVFTFPYSPTQAFPHPLVNIKNTNVDQTYTNFMSYPLVDLMTWQGLGDLVNRFRVQTLGLPPVSTLWAPGQLSRLKVPMTYLWSPGLVPKPADWGPEIDIAGYVFLELASTFEPSEELTAFLKRSDDRAIIYIGFGSISGIDDPVAFTKMVFEGVEKANVRAIISKGWGGMGDGLEKPDGVLLVDNVPHDWLFPRVDAVVHHGGAGTTAMGLKCGKPTMIVPFFGDQPFWSAMVAKAGAGAKNALPLKKLNGDKFAQGIRECLEPEAKAKAEEIARSIAEEGDGAENAVDSFHLSLPLEGKHSMRCGIFPERTAVWSVKHTSMKLSPLAADMLAQNKQLQWSDLTLIKHHEWTDFQGPGEPITGAGGVLVSAFQEAFHGISTIPETTKRDYRKYERRKRKQKGLSVADAVLLPGKIAHASRGVAANSAKEIKDQLDAQMNLHGEAEPLAHQFMVPRRNSTTPARPPNLRRTTTNTSDKSPIPVVILKDIGKGVGHSAKAIIRIPSEMFYSATLGFRNAPRLYGDRTVRPPPQQITGFRTGVEVAGTELWMGVFDGVAGLFRIPYIDIHEDGISGLPKGIARGFGGLVLKPISGVMGVPAYTVKGIQQGIRKRFRDTKKTERWIRRARMAQGAIDVQELKERSKIPPNLHPLPDAPHASELEAARTHVLTLWTSHDREEVAHAREKEQHHIFPVPSISKTASRAQTT